MALTALCPLDRFVLLSGRARSDVSSWFSAQSLDDCISPHYNGLFFLRHNPWAKAGFAQHPRQLSGAFQNYLRPTVILLDRPMDLNHLALQLTYVPDVLEVAGEHHHGEGTHQVILAEIKKGDSPIAFFDPQHLAADTSSFTYVFFGFPQIAMQSAMEIAGKRSAHDQGWKGGRNPHKLSL